MIGKYISSKQGTVQMSAVDGRGNPHCRRCQMKKVIAWTALTAIVGTSAWGGYTVAKRKHTRTAV